MRKSVYQVGVETVTGHRVVRFDPVGLLEARDRLTEACWLFLHGEKTAVWFDEERNIRTFVETEGEVYACEEFPIVRVESELEGAVWLLAVWTAGAKVERSFYSPQCFDGWTPEFIGRVSKALRPYQLEIVPGESGGYQLEKKCFGNSDGLE